MIVTKGNKMNVTPYNFVNSVHIRPSGITSPTVHLSSYIKLKWKKSIKMGEKKKKKKSKKKPTKIRKSKTNSMFSTIKPKIKNKKKKNIKQQKKK